MPDEQEKKVNELARKFGKVIALSGIKMMRSAFDIPYFTLTGEEIAKVIKNYAAGEVILLDGSYQLTDLETWLAIIAVDWTEAKKYKKEIYDCDNFSYSFASRMAEIFELNGAAAIYGKVFNKDTGELVGFHMWNGFIAKNGDYFELYMLEPITDLYTKVEKNQPIIIGNWKYEPVNFRLF